MPEGARRLPSGARTSAGARRPRRGAITIEEVARAAGVSRQTVSNALNAPHRVRPDTLERVTAAIRELGYQPDQSARSLRSGARRTIGYLSPVDDPFDPNPLMAGFLEALVDAAGAQGLRVLLFRPAPGGGGARGAGELRGGSGGSGASGSGVGGPPGAGDALAAIDELVAARQVDGLVLADVLRDDPRIGHVARVGVPFTTFGRTGPGEPPHWVDIGNGPAMAAVVRHLAERGHRRLGYVGGADDLPWMAERRAGFLAEARRLGLPAQAAAGSDVAAVRELLRGPDRPTAVAAASDLLALDVYEAVRAEGLTVGGEVAVTGFHDTPLCRHLHPALTSVRLPLRAIAAALVERLLGQVRGEGAPGAGLELPTELVVRASSGG
ncbi:LacI family DNA-binding transcriptional regulator [Streptomyces sp. SP17BM10]|uniref:LacI family DNA-binding transcriptional regulator n=1 Tax=Streptomyces sp. SP17BM10 TaxID=3002530 RepID=UPI002E76323B|nr:LacI family DNA-binding transcriptional regulator [Streptomyces sp. SP17BM10]MEE1786439.1 LacI family DNA-binding transcriptional regulator [Streptomyces sp. SP17BM10]